MQILLPPSEGKHSPASGPSLNFDHLHFPELNSLRKKLATELMSVSGRTDALEILKAGVSVITQVKAQRNLLSSPCAPAFQIYTGVLFEALDLLHAKQRELAFAQQRILIFSGLFGVLRPKDLIPSYRFSMGTRLPILGNNKRLWTAKLKHFTASRNELVIDCRSGNYQVWSPPHDSEWITISAVSESQSGKRSVISHNAKHFRGLLAHKLVKSQADLHDGKELVEFVTTHMVKQGLIDGVELVEDSTVAAKKIADTAPNEIKRTNSRASSTPANTTKSSRPRPNKLLLIQHS